MSDEPAPGSELLEEARRLAAREGVAVGIWPRAASLLARQALEEALDRFWRDRALALDGASTHAQLLCLPSYAGRQVADETSWAWWSLTRACHHHPYELAPTATELEPLFATVERLVARLAPAR